MTNSETRTALSQASVAAALEAAAKLVRAKAGTLGSINLAEAVMALITPDQRTALQAAIGAAKAEARAEDAQAVKMLVFAAQTFCNRVEAGEIRSKRSYAMFKDALAQIGAKP